MQLNKRLHVVAPAGEDGRRLDRFLADHFEDLSRARIKEWIDAGLVKVDGAAGKASRKVAAGQSIEVLAPEVAPPDLAPDPEVAFTILYEDDDLVVVDKPAGLVVHPAAGHQTGTLVHGLLAACRNLAGVGGEARPGIVHRLDKDTSGVMVAAKNDAAHQALVEAFQGRRVEKHYLAVTCRAPADAEGEIDAPIGRHPVRRKEMSTRSRRGRPAVTRYRRLKTLAHGLGLVELTLLTGRTHQIRVHLAEIGCPVLADPVYGRISNRKVFNRVEGLARVAGRQMLHAHKLAFAHPGDGRRMAFEAEPPVDFVNTLELLGETKGERENRTFKS
jgi:23S rRNA pseudouridine1911/1915/1917 synthase